MNRAPRAVIVADLGFGDSGKGLVTDALARRLGARTVVRFNGGAQAGHNVVTSDGRHHTFSQFGAGTFVPGVRTFLSRHVAVHPTALLVEGARLARCGVADAWRRLYVSEGALLITPFHQAAARLRELARGPARHGSCGVGFGEAVADAQEGGEVLRMRHLGDRRRLRRELAALQERKRAELGAAPRGDPKVAAELRVLEDAAVAEEWIAAVETLPSRLSIVGDERLGDWLREDAPVVFEGAQGVLLDQWHGFHPHTTWSTCTFDNALGLLREQGYERPIERLGVLRTFLTRHGPGPFPTEAPGPAGLTERHNGTGPWQGPVRSGWPDWVLLRYALDACGGADGLALTHLDACAGRRSWRAAVRYELPQGGAAVDALPPAFDRDLLRQRSLTELVSAAAPIYRELRVEDYVDALQHAARVPIRLTSDGPTARAVRFRDRAQAAASRSR